MWAEGDGERGQREMERAGEGRDNYYSHKLHLHSGLSELRFNLPMTVIVD